MDYIIIDSQYMDYLRENVDSRIPNTDYGLGKIKPFFGVLFEKDDLYYVVPISHAQPKHQTLKNSMTLVKIWISDKNTGNKLAAVVNLCYMLPVRKDVYEQLTPSKIKTLTASSMTPEQQSRYIDLLQKEKIALHKAATDKKAQRLYNAVQKDPDSIWAKKCMSFAALEQAAKDYKK